MMCWPRPGSKALLLCVVIACGASCGSRTELAALDRVDLRPDARSASPSDAGSASCVFVCEAELIAAGLPLHSSWVDVARTARGWLVVQGDDEEPRRLHIASFSADSAMTSRSVDVAVRVEEPTLAVHEAAGIGVAVFREGLLWVDDEGAALSEVVVASEPGSTPRGGRPITLEHSFLIWSGDHVAGSTDRGLEAALVAPLAEVVSWEGVMEAPFVAGLTPDFERHEEGLIGAWTVFTRRAMFIAWMDELGRPQTTRRFDAPELLAGRVDRFGRDVALIDGKVAALRATARRAPDGRVERVVVLDLFDERGRADFGVVDTPLDPDGFFTFLEVLRHTAVAIYDHDGAVGLLPLMGDCPSAAPIDLVAGAPLFFDAVGPGEGLLMTRGEEGRGGLYSVHCDAAAEP